MNRNVLGLLRGTIAMMAGLIAIMAAGLAADLVAQGFPLAAIARLDVNEARHLDSLLNRSSNQIVAVVFTTVAIAVPLTANMYSVKFLEFFLKDMVNATVLTIVLVANLGAVWVGYGLKQEFVPRLEIHALLALTVLCFALVIPYLYYVFRFLHPHTLLGKLESEIVGGFSRASRHPQHAAGIRERVAQGIEHVANVAIRSVDRADRSTAIESVLTLDRVARSFWRVKPALPPSWFETDANLFLGFSSQAVAEFAASRTWVEMKVFSQLRQVMSAAVPSMHDLVSTIAKVSRKLGLEDAARHDPALRDMVIDYFNTFVRLALNRRDVRSLFILFDQYRTFAEALCVEHAEEISAIADNFQYYGRAAREQQMPFVVELVAHDLGVLVEHAWGARAANREQLVDRFVAYEADAPSPLPGVKKAQALVASYFLLEGEEEPVERIARSFAGLGRDFVASLRDELLRVTREKYWEVNERRMNIDYVPEPRREKLREFFAGLADARREVES
jgi:hypothetical protein